MRDLRAFLTGVFIALAVLILAPGIGTYRQAAAGALLISGIAAYTWDDR